MLISLPFLILTNRNSLFIMTQITAKGGSVVLDYYPLKDWNNNILPDKYLRILTFRGETQNKRYINEAQLDSEVKDRVDNFSYKITDNLDNLPQYYQPSLSGN